MKKLFTWVFIVLFLLVTQSSHATIFVGLGSGMQYASASDGKSALAVNLFSEIEYGSKYRHGLLLYSSISYMHLTSYTLANNFFVWGLGLKYTPEFMLEQPNLTDKMRKKSNSLLIFAPFTILYDIYYAAVQHILPTHFFILSTLYLVSNTTTGAGVGFGIAPGLTSGSVDVKVPFKYFAYNRSLSDWQLGLELSYHIAFGGKIAEYKPMIGDDSPSIIK